jgi:hypothetical protein
MCAEEQTHGYVEEPIAVGVWATGGTTAMVATASYPDPFTDDDDSCVLTYTVTQRREPRVLFGQR